MANQLLPLLAIGGGALLLMGGKKKRSGSKKTESVDEAEKTLPSVDEDLDEEEKKQPRKRPKKSVAPSKKDPVVEPEKPEIPVVDDSYGKPAIGPSGVHTCASPLYTRDPEYLTPDIVIAKKALSRFDKESDYFFYIRSSAQVDLYNYMLARFQAMAAEQERRTVASVVLRDALKELNPECKWDSPVDSLDEPEQLVWEGGRVLAIMAQITADIQDPSYNELFETGERYTITRESLGEPDPGFMGAAKKPEPGRRFEILATDSSQENAEHLIGELVKLSGPNGEPNMFELRIVDQFNGVDVTPKRRTKHGFKVGSNAYFSQNGPTGIYRIFPEGMV